MRSAVLVSTGAIPAAVRTVTSGGAPAGAGEDRRLRARAGRDPGDDEQADERDGAAECCCTRHAPAASADQPRLRSASPISTSGGRAAQTSASAASTATFDPNSVVCGAIRSAASSPSETA